MQCECDSIQEYGFGVDLSKLSREQLINVLAILWKFNGEDFRFYPIYHNVRKEVFVGFALIFNPGDEVIPLALELNDVFFANVAAKFLAIKSNKNIAELWKYCKLHLLKYQKKYCECHSFSGFTFEALIEHKITFEEVAKVGDFPVSCRKECSEYWKYDGRKHCIAQFFSRYDSILIFYVENKA